MVKIPNWYKPVSLWPHVIIDAASIDIDPGDAELIMRLAGDIMDRWRVLSDDDAVEFERLYKANEHNAKAVIVAILELVKTVGAGKPLLSQYEELLKR